MIKPHLLILFLKLVRKKRKRKTQIEVLCERCLTLLKNEDEYCLIQVYNNILDLVYFFCSKFMGITIPSPLLENKNPQMPMQKGEKGKK
jgi:hypothetical protein